MTLPLPVQAYCRRYAITPSTYAERMARIRAYQRARTMADWTLFAPLDYRRWAGDTTTFRDAERSSAVAGDGDPVGLVDPLVGEPLVQEVSAERPVWTGEGITGDGVSFLRASHFSDYWSVLTGSGPSSATTAIRLSYGGASQGNTVPMGASSAETSGIAQWVVNRPDEGGLRFQSRGDVGTSNTDAPSVFSDLGDTVTAVVVYDASDDQRRMYIDGVLVDSTTPSGDMVGLHTAPVCILARGLDGDTADRWYEGGIEYVAFWSRALSENEIGGLP